MVKKNIDFDEIDRLLEEGKNVTEICKELKIDRSTYYEKMKENLYDIQYIHLKQAAYIKLLNLINSNDNKISLKAIEIFNNLKYDGDLNDFKKDINKLEINIK